MQWVWQDAANACSPQDIKMAAFLYKQVANSDLCPIYVQLCMRNIHPAAQAGRFAFHSNGDLFLRRVARGFSSRHAAKYRSIMIHHMIVHMSGMSHLFTLGCSHMVWIQLKRFASSMAEVCLRITRPQSPRIVFPTAGKAQRGGL